MSMTDKPRPVGIPIARLYRKIAAGPILFLRVRFPLPAPNMEIKKIFNLDKLKPHLWLTLIGCAVFAPTLFFGFTYLDDNVLILDNLNFLSNFGNIFKIFNQDVFFVLHGATAYYRPIYTLSFMLNAFIGGAEPFVYHLTNLALHLTVVNLVYYFFKKLDLKQTLAFIGAMVFAVHPLVTATVAWMPGRNDSLVAIFILASLIFFVKFWAAGKWSQALGHGAFFALALFSKEVALVIVPVAGCYVWLLTKDKYAWRKASQMIAVWAPALIAWFILRGLALTKPMAYTFGAGVKSLWVNAPAVIQFLGKIIFPFNLSVTPIMRDMTFVYGWLALVILGALIFIGLKQNRSYWRPCLFGLLWFLIFLLPSFIRPDGAVLADFIEHRVYVPMLGIIFIVLTNPLLEKYAREKKYFWICVFGAVIFLSCLTFAYARNFKDRLIFWQNAVAHSPHYPLAHRNLGVMYYFEKDFKRAMSEYQEALTLNPAEPMAHNNLGVIYMNQGRLDEASAEYLEELKINPNYENALFNLGLIYFSQNRGGEAAKLWERIINVNPSYWSAYEGLAAYYQSINNIERANFYAQQVPKSTK